MGQLWYSRFVLPEHVERTLIQLEEARAKEGSALVIFCVGKEGQRCYIKFVPTFSETSVLMISVGHTPVRLPGPCSLPSASEEEVWPVRMEEVPDRGWGSFAIRDYRAGELLFEEEPYHVRLK